MTDASLAPRLAADFWSVLGGNRDALAALTFVGTGDLPSVFAVSDLAAASIGIVNGQPLLDLCYTEDVAASVDMNLVMNSAGEFIEVQGSGEEATFTESQLADLLALGKSGIRELFAAQQKALAEI